MAVPFVSPMSRLLVLVLLLAGASAVKPFALAGWGEEKVLSATFPGGAAVQPKFLASGRVEGTSTLLCLAADALWALDVGHPLAPDRAARKIGDVDPLGTPVAWFGDDQGLASFYANGAWEVVRLARDAGWERVGRIVTRDRFGVSLVKVGGEIWVTSPVQSNERFSGTLTRFRRTPSGWDSIRVPLPFPSEEKGFFFHTVRQTRKGPALYFVARGSRTNEASLRDALCVLPLAADGSPSGGEFERMPVAGTVFHRPSLLRLPRLDLLLYSSRRGPAYGLSLFGIEEGIELALGENLQSVVDPQAAVRGERIEIFGLQAGRDESRIVRLDVDGGRIFEPGYLEQIRTVPATPPGSRVRALTTLRVADESWTLFYAVEGEKALRFAGPDLEVDAPVVEALFRKDAARNVAWPDFTWSPPEDASGIAGYAFAIDRFPGTLPRALNLGADERSVTAAGLAPGTWWLHLVAIDALRNVSPAVHLRFDVVSLVSAARPPTPPRRIGGSPATPRTIAEIGDATSESVARDRYFEAVAEARRHVAEGALHLAREACNQALLIRPDGFEVAVLLEAVGREEESLFGGRFPIAIALLGALLCLLVFGVYRRVATR